MKDLPVIHIGENSPEKIAYELTRAIAALEKKLIRPLGVTAGADQPDRKWLLDTYAECLSATKGYRIIDKKDKPN